MGDRLHDRQNYYQEKMDEDDPEYKESKPRMHGYDVAPISLDEFKRQRKAKKAAADAHKAKGNDAYKAKKFDEAITHYGEAIKALINEQCGDGIMSAIDFYMDVGTTTGTLGEKRVVITFNGKFLPFIEQAAANNGAPSPRD